MNPPIVCELCGSWISADDKEMDECPACGSTEIHRATASDMRADRLAQDVYERVLSWDFNRDPNGYTDDLCHLVRVTMVELFNECGQELALAKEKLAEHAALICKYKTALEFYANLENYDKVNGSIHDMRPRGLEGKTWKVLDFGDRAREALKP